jgi:5'-nucleotidase
MRKFVTRLLLFSILLLGFNKPLLADEQRLTIIHTNDLHSHFLGFSPNSDYTPLTTGDDKTIGGWARIASVIKAAKATRDNPVLVLDAGDFLMGSLFHTVSREEALELVLMKEMGVDVTTIGNHEFDFKPEGLARIIASAANKSAMPEIVSSNLIFSSTDDRDDLLEEQFRAGLVKPYTVIERDGLKIGIFGLVGEDAAEVSPFAKPVEFGNPVEYARRMVAKLRGEENVDIVICLSHGGLDENPSKSEDLILAQEVDGIDVIISGHTDTLLNEPIVENGTIIVHGLGYGKRVGVLDLVVTSAGLRIENYNYVTIDDTIAGDERIDGMINSAIETTNQLALRPIGLEFDQVVAETEFDLVLKENESNLGNLVTDAILWAANRAEYDPADPASRVDVAILSNGVIRDDIITGKTGRIAVSDLFRVVPLGIGSGGSVAYPLVSVYVTGAELKKMFEVLTTLPPLKGSNYFLQMSGVKLTFNPNRMLFDRVTDIQIGDGNGGFVRVDFSDGNTKNYRVVANIYNATFLKVIGEYTMGILTIVPKDKSGKPIEDLTQARIDGDPDTPGVQEIKDWTALIGYVQSFADTNGNGIPDIPARYASLEGRQTIDASLNPVKLLSGGNYLTWIAAALLAAALLLVILIIYVSVKIIRKRKATP